MPTAVAHADAWAWSLDTVLSLSSVIVAALGAIATVLIAALALAQTRRANRLQELARVRAERAALSSAVEGYLATWKFGTSLIERGPARDSLLAAATAISPDAADVAHWFVEELEHAEYYDIEMRERPPRGVWIPEVDSTMRELRSRARSRVTRWVATGVSIGHHFLPIGSRRARDSGERANCPLLVPRTTACTKPLLDLHSASSSESRACAAASPAISASGP